jgi:hypothetical protein
MPNLSSTTEALYLYQLRSRFVTNCVGVARRYIMSFPFLSTLHQKRAGAHTTQCSRPAIANIDEISSTSCDSLLDRRPWQGEGIRSLRFCIPRRTVAYGDSSRGAQCLTKERRCATSWAQSSRVAESANRVIRDDGASLNLCLVNALPHMHRLSEQFPLVPWRSMSIP